MNHEWRIARHIPGWKFDTSVFHACATGAGNSAVACDGRKAIAESVRPYQPGDARCPQCVLIVGG